jgi:hypothetical protein
MRVEPGRDDRLFRGVALAPDEGGGGRGVRKNSGRKLEITKWRKERG